MQDETLAYRSQVRGDDRACVESMEELTQRNIETVTALEKAAHDQRTRSDVVADAIANFCGSMAFVWVHILWFGSWIFLNVLALPKPFDKFPFPALTLMVSLEAIFLTTFIMISQNRQARVADRRNHLDLQINLLAEQENSKMLAMLEAITQRLGIEDLDPKVRVLEEETCPAKVMQQIERVVEQHGSAV